LVNRWIFWLYKCTINWCGALKFVGVTNGVSKECSQLSLRLVLSSLPIKLLVFIKGAVEEGWHSSDSHFELIEAAVELVCSFVWEQCFEVRDIKEAGHQFNVHGFSY